MEIWYMNLRKSFEIQTRCFGFERWIWVLIASVVPDLYLSDLFKRIVNSFKNVERTLDSSMHA